MARHKSSNKISDEDIGPHFSIADICPHPRLVGACLSIHPILRPTATAPQILKRPSWLSSIYLGYLENRYEYGYIPHYESL